MKRILSALLVLPLAIPTLASAEQLIPAGSIIKCTVAEPKISSKTQNIGDPILCQVSHVEMYGRSTFPYGTYLVGHFEDYKDPGHFVGKGYMELKFDRLVTHNDTIVPMEARVIAVPKYAVDNQGRILGNGHAVKDTVEWLIPVLWPIDLINLPRRGPRPVLKAETPLTLKVIDDFGIPSQAEADHRQALISRIPDSDKTMQELNQQSNYQPQAPYQQPAPQPQYAPAQYQQQPAPIERAYAPAPSTVIYQNFGQPAPQQQAQLAPQVIVQQAAPVVVQPRPTVVYHYPPPPPRYVPYGYGPYGGYYAPY